MSEHEMATDRQVARFISAVPAWSASAAAARTEADGSADRVVCRLGDASCASSHAVRVNRAAVSGRQSSLHRSLLEMQRDYGNRYVGQVLRQASAAGHDGEGAGMDAIERSIDQARGSGHGMDHATRTRMESAFGADFSGVRIHADTRADGLSQSLAARAFTTGRDVFFRQGEYSPGTSEGRELLAHELTHVVQQTGDGVQRKMTVSEPGDPHEVEADQMARAVMQQEHAPAADPPAVSRDEDDEKPVAAKHASEAFQRQPETPTPQDEEEKKKLHAKPASTVVSRQEDEEAPGG